MPAFRVRYRNPDGSIAEQPVHAGSRQDIAAALSIPPAHVLAVEEAAIEATRAAHDATDTAAPARPIAPQALRLFCQELALLLDSGIPLLEAVETLDAKHDGAASAGFHASVTQQLRMGLPLSAALVHSGFDPLTVAIVSASERSGQLSRALQQHAAYLQWLESLRARIVKASIYPTTLLAVGGAVALFLLLYVMPRFTSVLDGLRHELPWTSRWMVQLGNFANAHPLALLAMAIGPVVIALLVAAVPAFRVRFQSWMWRWPWVGPQLKLVALARLYRALGLLLSAGAPVAAALQALRGVMPWHLQPKIDGALRAVREGQRLSDALVGQQLTTPVAERMLRVGERTGELALMSERAAVFHDEEIGRLTEFVTDILNPVLMLVVGVVVGGIIVLMYLPIFQLVEQVQ